ncbi:MAG: hypothetical protein IIC89_07870, partial [Chloroflexi bacterium]|nr:hypothetical protein [Chloroflexota bacterium]
MPTDRLSLGSALALLAAVALIGVALVVALTWVDATAAGPTGGIAGAQPTCTPTP